ncbi:MAG: PQQ-dependent sugar dehydrogenase [Pirellulales bacterium]
MRIGAVRVSWFNRFQSIGFLAIGGLAMGLCDSALAQTGTVRVTTGIERPIFAISPPGDSSRLFIAEQHTGRIEILDLASGTILGTPFLDLSELKTGNEQGLLGLAFDPDYANNGHFYVNVTTTAGSGDTHIRRYTVTGNPVTLNLASVGSQFEILSYNQPQVNHNGGWIGFSPRDSYLYIASGDGGGSNDNDSGHTARIGNAQDITNNLLGKMLRIDVAGDDFPDDATRNYSIPGDNPLVGVTGDDEIWAYGLRNPYRSSFDRETGDLWIGDVGQNVREEIDFQHTDSAGGENYGWRLREGTIPTPTGGVGGSPPPGNVEPIYDYDHSEPDPDFRGNVVIGGYVYRGPVDEFRGHYFFADSGSDNIWKLDPDAVNPRDSVTRVNNDLLPDAGSIHSIGSFGEDDDGNLYVMEVFGGELFRVATESENVVWNGDDATVGIAGNGFTWGNADNWTRGGTVDQSYLDEDHVIFSAGSSQSNINLGATRIVSAATFEAPYTLQSNTLRVLSGNISVDTGVVATIESTLEAESTNHSLRKLGMGTLLVNGIAGQMVVKEGTLGGVGTLEHLTVRAGGMVAPGASIGTLNVGNSFTMEADASLSIEVGGTAPGEFDQLLIDGLALLGGILNVELVGLYQPQAGDSIPFLVAQDGAGGMFDAFNLPFLGPHLEWQINPGGISVFLSVNSTLEGDFDNDADVDSEDLAAWEEGYGLTGGAGRSDGDADSDFDVDGADFLIWQQQVGIGVVPLEANSATVPEPTTATLVVVGMLLLNQFRCRLVAMNFGVGPIFTRISLP